MGSDQRGSHPSESDDDISVTSTVPSELQDEYVVEGIIAERDNDGTMEYLARWEGYPDERCTWEIRSHFTETTLLDWETQKMRVARGYAKPYNVEALLDRVEKWIVATKQRKLSRRAKRLRLGLPVTPTEEIIIDEDDSYEEVEESSSDEEHELESPVSRNSSKSKSASLSDSRGQSGPRETPLSSSRPVAPVAKMARNWTEEETSGYLRDMLGAQSIEPNQMQGPGKAPTAVMSRPQNRDSRSGDSKSLSTSSGTSPTEIAFGQAGNARQRDQATGHSKKRSSAAKSSPTTSKVGIDGRGPLSENHSLETEQASKLSSASSPKHALPTLRRASLAGPDSLRKAPKELSHLNSVSSAVQKPRRGSLPEPSSKPSATSLKTSGKSAKESRKNSNGTRQTQVGNGNRGPARLSLPKSKLSTAPSKKVGAVSGAAILRNWNKDLKRRKSNAFQPGSSDKPAQKFSTIQRYYKKGRNEPAPNIEMLTFMDLKKGGGVAKKPSLVTPKIKPPKTPYQIIQESLKANADAQQKANAERLSEELFFDDENHHADSVNLRIEQSTQSKVQSSNPVPSGSKGASPLEAPSGPGQNFEKGSSSVTQEHQEQNATSRQSLIVPESIEKAGISKDLPMQEAPPAQETIATQQPSPVGEVLPRKDALPKRNPSPTQDPLPPPNPSPIQETLPTQDATPIKDVSVASKAPHNERGFSNANRNLDALAPSHDRSASTAQPAVRSKHAYSSSYAPTQTASTIPYGSTTFAQRSRVTPTQVQLMNSGVENDILGNILVEQVGKDLGDVRFRGMDRVARQLFLTIKVPPRSVHVTCKNICTIGEYQEFYRGEPHYYISSGFVLPFWPSFGPVWDMAETLKNQASCALFYCEKFSLLFYPVDSGLESWDFLNKLQPPVPEGTLLRFMMRKPLPPPPPELDLAEFDFTGKESLLSSLEAKNNINFVFQEILGIEYERLIKQSNPKKTAESNHFFLLFVGVEKEFSLMCRYLAANGAKIYNWEDEGAWDYFRTHVEHGVILIEGSFYRLYLIPHLWRLLSKPINIFNITFYADEMAPHPHINRLFPHGQAILITDSFLLLRPHETARFLRWFRLWVLMNKVPGNWKLCLRPGIRDFLLTLIEQRSEEDGFVFMQMYESLWYIIPEDQVDDEDLEDDIVLDTDLDGKTVRCMSSGVSNFDQTVGMNMIPSGVVNEEKIARNDATLVQWFAGWAMTQLESVRRFPIISGSTPGRHEMEKTEWESKWSHINLYTAEAALEFYKVPGWEREYEENKKRKEELRRDREKEKGKERNEADRTPTATSVGPRGELVSEKAPMSA